MGRGGPERNGDGRPGHSGGASGFQAETLLDLRPDQLLDSEEAPLDLDAILRVCVARCGVVELYVATIRRWRSPPRDSYRPSAPRTRCAAWMWVSRRPASRKRPTHEAGSGCPERSRTV